MQIAIFIQSVFLRIVSRIFSRMRPEIARFISPLSFENLCKIQRRWSALILLTPVLLVSTALAITHPNFLHGGLKGANPASPSNQSHAAQQIQSGLTINLTRFGFEPAAATITTGKCIVTVHNVTDRDSVDLIISRENGERLIAEKMRREQKRWYKVLDLTPGEYLISAAGNPDWTCKLTVIPPGK